MNWREILWLIVIGILLAVCSFLGIRSCKQVKVIKEKDVLLNACMNAPKDTLRIHDSIPVYDTIWRTPGRDTIHVHDPSPPKYCEEYYADKYNVIKDKDTGVIYYAIHSRDCGVDVKFPKVVLPKEKIIITEHVDTCILKPPAYIPKNHFGLDLDIYGRNIKEFPGGGADFWWTYKDKWGLKGGGFYLPQVNTGFAIIGVKIFIR